MLPVARNGNKNGNCPYPARLTCRIASTFLISFGSVIYKTGNSAIFFQSLADHYQANDLLIPFYVIFLPSGLYSRLFTRVHTIWDRLGGKKKEHDKTEVEGELAGKLVCIAAYTIGTINAVFLAANTYVSAKTLLSLINISDKVANVSIATYASGSYFITYMFFTVSKMVRNSYYFLEHARTKTNKKTSSNKSLFLTIFLGIFGIAAFGVHSFFLTLNTLSGEFPYSENLSNETRNSLAIVSTTFGVLSSTLAKGISLYQFFDAPFKSHFQNVKKQYKYLLFSHLVLGSIYVINLGIGFFVSGINFFENIELKDPDSLIPIYALFAVSGIILEFPFNVVTMIKKIKETKKPEATIDQANLETSLIAPSLGIGKVYGTNNNNLPSEDTLSLNSSLDHEKSF